MQGYMLTHTTYVKVTCNPLKRMVQGRNKDTPQIPQAVKLQPQV